MIWRTRSRSTVLLALVALAGDARAAAGQVWTPRAGQGGVTFATQMIDHVGRLLDNGSRIACCGTTNTAVYVEFDYGFTDRLSISAGIPYVFAKYRGGPPGPAVAFLPYPPADACHCVQSSFQGHRTQFV